VNNAKNIKTGKSITSLRDAIYYFINNPRKLSWETLGEELVCQVTTWGQPNMDKVNELLSVLTEDSPILIREANLILKANQ